MKNFLGKRESARLARSGGFIKMVIIIVAALVLLKYIYNIDIVGYLTQGKFRDILDQIYAWSYEGWQKYKEAIIGIWNKASEFIKDLLSKPR